MSSAAFTTSLPVNFSRLHLRHATLTSTSVHHRRPLNGPVFCAKLSVPTARPKSKSHGPSPSSRQPLKGNHGKRVPTYRKLQTRHRVGPSVFRRKADIRSTKGSTSSQLEFDDDVRRQLPTSTQTRDRRGATSLGELQVGQKFKGVVHNLVRHGAYVDIGARKDGLVHVRDMSVDFVHEVEDFVRPNDELTVWVKYVDPVSNILALTMLPPALGFEVKRISIADITKGQRVKAVVQRVTNFGAYVDAGFERHAFVHVRRLWGRNPSDTLQILRLGQEMVTEVVLVDEVRSYVALTARGKRGVKLSEDVYIDNDVEHSSSKVMDIDQDTIRAMALLRIGEELDDGFQVGNLQSADLSDSEDDDESRSDEICERVEEGFRDDVDAEALAAQVDADEIEDDDDDDDDNVDDEFAFAEKMGSVKALDANNGTDFSEIAHMVTDDTELVGLDPRDIEKLKQLRKEIGEAESD